MKHYIFTFILAISHLFCLAQKPFEGEVVYHNVYSSKRPSITDAQLTARMGSEQHWYVKGGNYKSTANGSAIEWLLYLNHTNRVYVKSPNTSLVHSINVAANPDSLISFEVHKNTATILGYKCDELILHTKRGLQRYYYTSKLPVNSRLYARHQYGNWYAFVSRAHAVALKQTIETKDGTMVSTAIAVTPMKLTDRQFTIPSDVQVISMPSIR